jgi:CBS domain-containing protein
LVLQAASSPSADIETTSNDRRGHIIRLLRSGGKVPVSLICSESPFHIPTLSVPWSDSRLQARDHLLILDISGKNPCHRFHSTSTLRDLVPLLASGIHRVLLSLDDSGVRILTASNVLEHLVASHPPEFFDQTFLSPSLDLPLHPLVSLTGSDSVLDAMQVMSLNNLSALGVIDQSTTSVTYGQSQGHRRGSSSSGSSTSFTGIRKEARSGSSSFYKSPSSSQVFTISPQILPSPGAELPSPFDGNGSGSGSGNGELMNVITAEGCARLVVPSQGKEALGMGLGEAAKMLQQVEYAGQERGEERVPGEPSFFQSC